MSTVTLAGNPINIGGHFPATGSQAADFSLTTGELGSAGNADYAGKRKILNIFPSVDTGVCAASVRRFNQDAGSLSNTVVLCISADLPFAQARFCGAEGLDNVVMLSTFRNPEFKQAYGVDIETALSRPVRPCRGGVGRKQPRAAQRAGVGNQRGAGLRRRISGAVNLSCVEQNGIQAS